MRVLQVSLLVLAVAVGVSAADNPFSGSWKINRAKATISPPSPRSETIEIKADDNGIVVANTIIGPATGSTLKGGYKAKFDGKDYIVSGNHHVDSIALQRMDTNTLKATAKKAGKVVSDSTLVVSQDGKTLTVNYAETDAQGNSYKGSDVYEKQ